MSVRDNLLKYKNRASHLQSQLENNKFIGAGVSRFEKKHKQAFVKYGKQMSGMQDNKYVRKAERTIDYAGKHEDELRQIGSELGEKVALDAGEGAAGGTAAEPGGGTALGAIGGAAVGVGRTVFDHWATIKKLGQQ